MKINALIVYFKVLGWMDFVMFSAINLVIGGL